MAINYDLLIRDERTEALKNIWNEEFAKRDLIADDVAWYPDWGLVASIDNFCEAMGPVNVRMTPEISESDLADPDLMRAEFAHLAQSMRFYRRADIMAHQIIRAIKRRFIGASPVERRNRRRGENQ